MINDTTIPNPLQDKLTLIGQNNPPHGWHVFENNHIINMGYVGICGLQFDLTHRIYFSDTDKIKTEYVCKECLRIAAARQQDAEGGE